MKVCVSVGAKTYALLKKKADAAIKLGADLVELRLDYLRTFDIEKLKNVTKGIESRCILTLRSSKEGGRFKRVGGLQGVKRNAYISSTI